MVIGDGKIPAIQVGNEAWWSQGLDLLSSVNTNDNSHIPEQNNYVESIRTLPQSRISLVPKYSLLSN